MEYTIAIAIVLVIVLVVVFMQRSSHKVQPQVETPANLSVRTQEQHLEGNWNATIDVAGVSSNAVYNIRFGPEGVSVVINGNESVHNARYASVSTSVLEMYTLDDAGRDVTTQFSITGADTVEMRRIPDRGTSPILLRRAL